MKKTRWSLLIGLLLGLFVFPLMGYGQNLSVKYQNQTLEEVITDLKQRTDYSFVYQKRILEGKEAVTAEFMNVPLEYILDRVLLPADLEYEIVEKSVIIRAMDKGTFRQVVSGKVTDEEGLPVPGVNVRVKDTQSGVATDINGDFSIMVDSGHPFLVFSFMGMLDKEVRVTRDTKSPLAIQMQADVKLMDEVVVTGYQNIKRENATGSYQVLSTKELGNRYTENIVSNLEGRIPGLVAYNNGSSSGEEALTIRGVSSFQARTNPLVVVDGLPIEGSIETVNPYDIENITVLKDASATSIYGARAANGVIVITTKRATEEKLSIDVSADWTVSELQTYDNYDWATPAQVVDLEEMNFEYVKTKPEGISQLQSYWTERPDNLSPIMQLMYGRYLGEVSDADYQTQMDEWRGNDYRKEWQDVMQRRQFVQQYNAAFRTRGKYLNSSIVLNYKGNNTGMVNQYDRALTLSYKGDMNLTKFLDVSVGLNLINENTKTHADLFGYKGMHAFAPYMSMYNPDGTKADMRAAVDLSVSSLSDPTLGLKSEAYNLLDEVDRNFTKTTQTNLRAFAHVTAHIIPGLDASAQYQYENIYSKGETYYEADSYDMRHLYNLYTSGGTHYIPEGGLLQVSTTEGKYFTFRTQATFNRTFADKHAVEALAGFEFRESRDRTTSSTLYGYDDQTQTNTTHLMNFDDIRNLQTSDLGTYYQPYGAPTDYTTTDILHRFYSLYFNGNYTYDSRYSASFSYRVDKADLFGADPEFRGRPLWSVGLSWNMHNEAFMKSVSWINALKWRFSYGLAGNIDSSVSSYLTATIAINDYTGDKGATLNTPPNDQLRWEKTASWNVGVDFSLFSSRLNGSLDWYRKYSSDLLTVTDLDPTTGWTSLTINNGEALNTGVELMLSGNILRAMSRQEVGINATLTFAYNKNEVKKIEHEAASGISAINTLHEGYPVNSLFSYDFAGYVIDDAGIQQISWRKADGSIQIASVGEGTFTPEDIVFSGGLDPKYTANLTPELTYQGFSLSAMFSYYAGHYMRVKFDELTNDGSVYGYDVLQSNSAVLASYLKYWQSEDKTAYRANGYAANGSNLSYPEYSNQNVVPADYLKVRNIVLGYEFPEALCNKLHLGGARLRFQVNNVATWARNKYKIDPEANAASSGTTLDKTPTSYTIGLNINF